MGPTLYVFCGCKDNTKIIISNHEGDFFRVYIDDFGKYFVYLQSMVAHLQYCIPASRAVDEAWIVIVKE